MWVAVKFCTIHDWMSGDYLLLEVVVKLTSNISGELIESRSNWSKSNMLFKRSEKTIFTSPIWFMLSTVSSIGSLISSFKFFCSRSLSDLFESMVEFLFLKKEPKSNDWLSSSTTKFRLKVFSVTSLYWSSFMPILISKVPSSSAVKSPSL